MPCIQRCPIALASLKQRKEKHRVHSIGLQGAWFDANNILDAEPRDHRESLAALSSNWPSFEEQLLTQGWNLSKQVYKLGEVRIRKKKIHA